MLTDIRFRLLTFMSSFVTAAVALISVGLGQTATPPLLMVGVSVLGFFATLGVILYDQRNSELYNAHMHRAMLIEGALEMQSHSRFAHAGSYAGPHTLRARAEGHFLGLRVNHLTALSMIYAAILAAWLFPASRGLVLFFGAPYRGRIWQLANEWHMFPLFGSGNGNGSSLLALVLTIAAGVIFYRRLRKIDVPGLAETKIYGKANPARDQIFGDAKIRGSVRPVTKVMPVAAITVMLVALVTSVHAQPLPYPKSHDGQCAGSYVQSGGFCIPKAGGTVRESILKPRDGQCPSGWSSGASSCERMR
jgi:hypothetical protein